MAKHKYQTRISTKSAIARLKHILNTLKDTHKHRWVEAAGVWNESYTGKDPAGSVDVVDHLDLVGIVDIADTVDG